jgi:PAS domain S-box-containing protein
MRESLSSVASLVCHEAAEVTLPGDGERFRRLFESLPTGIHVYRLEPESRLIFTGANQAADDILGIDNSRFIGKTVEEAFPPLAATEIPDIYRRVAAYGGRWKSEDVPFEYGTIKGNFEVTAFQIAAGEVAVAFTEVSGRKQAEEAIRQSEHLLREIIDLVPHLIFVKDSECRYLLTNKAVAEAYGTTVTEIVGKSDIDFSPTPDQRMRFQRDDVEVIRSGRPKVIREESVTTAAGEIRVVQTTKIPFRFGPTGAPAVLGVSTDITEQRRAEQALRESEEKYRMVVENANDAIFIAQDGLIKFPNPRLGALTGCTADELTMHPFIDFVHPLDRVMVIQRHAQRLQGLDVPVTYPFRALSRSGETRWVEVTSILITWEDRPASLAFLRDITDHKKLEAQLFQAQKMEAVGQLAGGLAHDFNNFLTAIIGYSNLSLIRKSGDDPTRMFTEQILSAAEKAAQLTQNLLAFSRKQMLNVQPIDVNEVVTKVIKLLQRLIGEDIELKTRLSGSPAVTVADAGQLEQVLMNLATNARDAMPKGGTLLITTGVTVWSPNVVRVQGYGAPGRYVTIEVTDTGQGMDEQTRQRIFEPFFTTKKAGKGTGLGLSMVYGIVKQHEGYVNVESSPGRGSTFSLCFPHCLKETGQTDRTTPVILPPGGTETILLAEDDQEVRHVLRNILHEFGYRVIEAVNGEEAYLKFRNHSVEVDLVVTDTVMPRKNGLELYDDIRKIRPDIKVIFISGYPAGTFEGRRLDDPRVAYADKPLSPLTLLTKVKSLLKD